MTSSSAPPLSATHDTTGAPSWWRTPLLFLAIYCVISLVLKENYPISHYPMYANPSADRAYYIVADADTGKPLPIASVSGITCPKIGKIYRTKVGELTSKLDISKGDLTAEQKQEIGMSIFQELRRHAQDNNLIGLPPRLLLQRVDIVYKDGEMSEKPTQLAVEPAQSTPPTRVP